MSRPTARNSAGNSAGGPAPASLRVLTFEASGFHFALAADEVERIDPTGMPPAEGLSVVDAVGLLGRPGTQRSRSCVVVLAARGPRGERVAITAAKADDVRTIDATRLFPLPSYIFPGHSPFQGMAVESDASRGEKAIFLLAGPERILGCRSAAPA